PVNDLVFAAGDRIGVIVYGAPIGTTASGFTFSLGYDGATGAADGDSWVQFTETITEQGGAAAADPFPFAGGGYYGGFAALKRLWQGWSRRDSGIMVPHMSERRIIVPA